VEQGTELMISPGRCWEWFEGIGIGGTRAGGELIEIYRFVGPASCEDAFGGGILI